ncbi:hypothetical protein [Embleya sp. NPDC005971]|uniref:hypothetical protein n=1 Tax=Embleya sp. NPDC005971 TaxID=3156724 RepID=UPI0033C557B0
MNHPTRAGWEHPAVVDAVSGGTSLGMAIFIALGGYRSLLLLVPMIAAYGLAVASSRRTTMWAAVVATAGVGVSGLRFGAVCRQGERAAIPLTWMGLGAAIMIAVLVAFVLGGRRVIAEFGVGPTAAVALDALVPRRILIRAVTHPLSRSNRWLPARVDRRLPRLSIEAPEVVVPARPASEPGRW